MGINSISLSGMQGVGDKLALMTGKLDKQINGALRKIGALVQAGAQRRVPVSGGTGRRRDPTTGRFMAAAEPDSMPGNLRRSIRYKVNMKLHDVKIGVDSEDADYGVFIEFGTARIAGGAVKRLGLGMVTDARAVRSWPALMARSGSGQQMPFLRPSAMANRDEAMRLFEQALRRATSG